MSVTSGKGFLVIEDSDILNDRLKLSNLCSDAFVFQAYAYITSADFLYTVESEVYLHFFLNRSRRSDF